MKIIYSITVALVLSVILALLVPRWFFVGDARWTYQSDTARMDIYFEGNLKNGRLSMEGTGMEISQPKWLSDHRFQGTMNEFSVSYRKCTYQMRVTPQADDYGEDATLVIKFRGKDFQYGGKRRPAWVAFRNITLNGQSIADNKVVWHDQPFILKYPFPTQEITLTFDVCKPLAASDISFQNIFVIFCAFLLFSLFFTPLKRVIEHALTFINRKDIVQVISDGYRHTDPVYRRSFWIIFGVLCFAFGFHTICFMWGNHDWSLLEHGQRWLSHKISGRYMVSSIKVLLFKGVYLPLVYDLVTFITLALNAVLLCRYWRLEKRVTYFVLCGLVLTVQPFTLGMMYYINVIPEVFIGVTCVLVALLLSEKIAVVGMSLTKKILYSLTAVILINFALAMYPVLINTIAVVFVGRMLVQSFNWDGSLRQLKACAMPFVISGINILLGGVVYKLVITYIFPVKSIYNTDTLPLEHVPERMRVLCGQSFRQLYEYHDPFISQWTLWVFMGFTIMLIIYMFSTGTFRQKVVRFCLLLGSLYATQTAMVIAKTHLIAERVELFGLVFFEVLVLALVLTHLRKLRNLCVITGSCVIFASVINDLDCLRVWELGFDAEKMLWNRVLARLEVQKEFNPAGKYDVIQVGPSIALRPCFYPNYSKLRKKFNRDDNAPLRLSYDLRENLFGAYEFYYPTRFRSKKRYSVHRHIIPEYTDRLRCLYQAGVLQKAEVWPKPNGLIVWKNIILFVTDGKELDNYRKKFERELGKK